jgi:hypothetical protein
MDAVSGRRGACLFVNEFPSVMLTVELGFVNEPIFGKLFVVGCQNMTVMKESFGFNDCCASQQ